jgi:deoxyhypusine synthase
MASEIPAVATAAVLTINNETLDVVDHPVVKGVDFNKEVKLDDIMNAMATTGFQASEMSRAIHEINRMRNWRLSDEPIKEDEDESLKTFEARNQVKCKIFLSYTSNMISCGVRETIRYLVQHKLVDVLVTTAGGIEEDIMKCITPHHMGDFNKYKGPELRKRGINRIGNMLVPNVNYCKFEDFMSPILDAMHDEQDASNGKLVWTPSMMIDRLGKEVNNPDSVYYWCHKNNIPVYCPAITDGSVGDMIYFASYKRPGFILDIARDIRGINDQAVQAKATGMIILGGGLVKHHTCNANLMRNGANFSVFINTGQAFDGSDSGAPPDEAISWGKIKIDAQPVKLYAEASLVFPLIVSQTFAKNGPRTPPAEDGDKKTASE